MSSAAVVSRVLRWYETNSRDLPWRRPEATPWQIMVSEFMLQQTPIERVLRPWQDWVDRWPTPAALAEAAPGDAVRAWGRLGYPRRAIRLHQAAVAIESDYGGVVPNDLGRLRSLPGVGAYTAAAILSFAYGQRHTVLDTNVRRLLARLAAGAAFPASAPTAQDRVLAAVFLPRTPARAARWAVASMELGAVVCTARAPRCPRCPVQRQCAWRAAGYPAWDGPPRRGQSYIGTDRQCRGALLSVLRSSDGSVPRNELDQAWPDPDQRERALDSLLVDGLAVAVGEDLVALPG